MSCFNDAAHVATAIQSIQQQTLTNWELIVINDGSTDETKQILQKFAKADPRIKVIEQENTGLTRALISGCDIAKAEFIARQDADDISLPTRLEQQHAMLMRNSEVGFVSCCAEYIGPGNEYLKTQSRPADSETATYKLLNEKMGPPAHGTVMFRKAVYQQVGGYRHQFYFAQDADLWLRMAEVSQVAYVQEAGYQFRWHESSITGSGRSVQSKFGRLGQLCREARRENNPEEPWLEEAEELRASIISSRQQLDSKRQRAVRKDNQLSMTYLIGSQLVLNKDNQARFYLFKVIRQQPWHWKAWIRLVQSLITGEKRIAEREDSHS